MTEHEHLLAELRVHESHYAHARMKNDHAAAKVAAEEMARVNNLIVLLETQEREENHA